MGGFCAFGLGVLIRRVVVRDGALSELRRRESCVLRVRRMSNSRRSARVGQMKIRDEGGGKDCGKSSVS
jgi:hypothetical protein